MKPALMGALALLSLPACCEVSVSLGRIRLGPPGAPVAAYFQLQNNGDKAVTLTDIEAPWAGMAMIHESRDEGGTAKMRHVDRIEIPAHSSTAFTPGGLHVMIMQPGPLKSGEQRELLLIWADGSRQPIKLPVQGF